MRKYRGRLDFDFPVASGTLDDRDVAMEAVNYLAEHVLPGEIDDLVVVATDVQLLPEDDPEPKSARPAFPGPATPGISHPWDQGAWIFPEDHPLRAYEQMARQQSDEEQKQVFLEAGQKLLPEKT